MKCLLLFDNHLESSGAYLSDFVEDYGRNVLVSLVLAEMVVVIGEKLVELLLGFVDLGLGAFEDNDTLHFRHFLDRGLFALLFKQFLGFWLLSEDCFKLLRDLVEAEDAPDAMVLVSHVFLDPGRIRVGCNWAGTIYVVDKTVLDPLLVTCEFLDTAESRHL